MSASQIALMLFPIILAASIFLPFGILSPSPNNISPHHQRRHTASSISVGQSKRFHSGESGPPSPLRISGNLMAMPQSPRSPWGHLSGNLMSMPSSADRAKSSPFSGELPAATLSGNLMQFGRRMSFGGKKKTSSKIVGARKCDCSERAMDKMSTIRFNSDKDRKKRVVKVALADGPFGSGHQAKLYDGCFVTDSDQERKRGECVAVKLVGKGTIQSPKSFLDKLTKNQLLEDTRKEISSLLEVQRRYPGPMERRHIIQLYDGGEIFIIEGLLALNYREMFQYVVILEAGGDNYLEAFVKYCAKRKVLTEKSLMKFLEPSAETLVNVHKMHFIHMDWKPPNLLYVKEKLEYNHSGLKYFFSRPKAPITLKAIDFGGAMLLDGATNLFEASSSSSGGSNGGRRRLDKVTSTKHYLPPEMDLIFKHKIADRKESKHTVDNTDYIMPMTSSKSDMWQFGIMIYNMIFVWENIHISRKETNTEKQPTDVVTNKLNRINDLYKEANEIEKLEGLDLDKLGIRMETIEWVLDVRSKYPRLFLLITNLLDKNDDNRLSAKGVLEYLRMECRLHGRNKKIDDITNEAESAENKKEGAELSVGWNFKYLEFANERKKFIGEFTMNMLEEYYTGNEKLVGAIKKGDEEMAKMMKETEAEMRKVEKVCDRGYAEDEGNFPGRKPVELFLPEHAIIAN